jgi:hypothetical protein
VGKIVACPLKEVSKFVAFSANRDAAERKATSIFMSKSQEQLDMYQQVESLQRI